jgi:GntR family transcriptional regulator
MEGNMSSEMLYRILRSEIENEKLTIGMEMPTEAELCDQHHLSRGTVRVALQRLADEGYIRAGQGRKRTVQRRQPLKLERLNLSSRNLAVPTRGSVKSRSPSFGEYIASRGMEASDIVLRSETSVPCYSLTEEPRFEVGTQVSDSLEIKPSTKVHWFLRLRLGDGEPVALQWAVTVASMIPEVTLDCLVPGGLTQVYDQQGIRRATASATYCPTRASKTEATYLRVGTGAPLIEERRTSYYRPSDKTVPYEYLVCLYTERVALTFDWDDPLEKVRARQPKGGPRKRSKR